MPALDCTRQGRFPSHSEARDRAGLAHVIWPDVEYCITGSEQDACNFQTSLGRPVAVEPDLAPCHYGTWAGKSLKALPPADISCWAQDPNFVPPGGESRAAMNGRVARWLQKARYDRAVTLLILEPDVVRALIQACLDLGAFSASGLDIMPASWSVLSYAGRWRLQALSLPANYGCSRIISGSKSDH